MKWSKGVVTQQKPKGSGLKLQMQTGNVFTHGYKPVRTHMLSILTTPQFVSEKLRMHSINQNF